MNACFLSEKKMGSFSQTLCLLFLISVATFFFFFNSNFMIYNSKKFRLLLSSSTLHKKTHSLSFSPAPGPAPAPAPTPLHRYQTHVVYSKTPPPPPPQQTPPHRTHITPAVTKRRQNETKSRAQRITIVITTSVCTILVIFSIIAVILCRRLRRTRKKMRQRSKVNTNSSSEFYLNSLSAFIERDYHQSGLISKEMLENKNAVLVSSDPCSSSDDESFHSVYNSSHCSTSHSPINSPFRSPASELAYEPSSPSSHVSIEIPKVALNSAPPPPPPPPPVNLLPTCNSGHSPPWLNVHSSSLRSLPPPPPPPPLSKLPAVIKSKRSPPPPPPPPPPQAKLTPMIKSGSAPAPPPTTAKLPAMIKSGNVPPPPPPPPPAKLPAKVKSCSPPPPCEIQQNGSPLPKLKPLHWDKVRAPPDHSMVWDKIRSSSFELDEEMIESLFGYKTQSSVKSEEVKSKTASPSITKHVLEHQRLQNITILLKALNASTQQVCDALMQGRGMFVQQLEALVKMAPSKEEEEKLLSYKGDLNDLDPAEKFIKALLNIPFAFPRIEAMLYIETFEDEVFHLRKSFDMLEEACKELRSSRLFLRLLEAVLKTGNRMNVGTIRGGAKAFKLDALLKLADVKGTDGKTTLLHFVVQEIIRSECSCNSKADEKEEEHRTILGIDLVLGLSNELSNVKKTASMDLDVLISSVSNLTNGMNQLKHLVEIENGGNFVGSLNLFLKHAERVIGQLKDEEKRVLLHVREITEYYHGSVGKDEANPLRIFVIVKDFLSMLDRVCKDVRSLKNNPVIPFR